MAKAKQKSRGARLPEAVSDREKKEIAEWMLDGFNLLAERLRRSSSLGTRWYAPHVRAYGGEFKRIVVGETSFHVADELCNDLATLKRKGCSPLAIVELSLQCTSGGPLTVDQHLQLFRLTKGDLVELQQSAKWMAEMTTRLFAMALGGSCLFPTPLPEKTLSEWGELPGLPEMLEQLYEFLDAHPRLSASKSQFESSYHLLGLLYLLLRKYGLGSPTMSRLLRAVQYARRHVFPGSRSRSDFEPISLRQRALQKRMWRLFDSKEAVKRREQWKQRLKSIIARYLSAEFAEKRQAGVTLIDLLSQELRAASHLPGKA